jgi:hypothetical protein
MLQLSQLHRCWANATTVAAASIAAASAAASIAAASAAASIADAAAIFAHRAYGNLHSPIESETATCRQTSYAFTQKPTAHDGL